MERWTHSEQAPMIESTLGDLAGRGALVFSDGYRTRQDQLTAEGIPILRVADLLDGALSPSTGDRVADSYREKMGPKTSRAGDVLVSTKGTVGRVARVPEAFPEHVYSPQLCFLRVADPGILDGSWLYYWARSYEFLSQVAIYSGQTDMAPYLSLRDLSAIAITIPPLDEQRRIAGVLGALDDLIEVNRGLIADLDATLAASWSMAARASATTRTFGEVADASKGLSYKGAFLAERGLPMINMGSFGVDGNYRESGLKWYVESEVKPKNRLVKGDLVVVNTDLTQSRDILARPIIVPFEHATSTHHTYQVRVPAGEAQRFWLYCALREESVRQRLISYATGTTVAALPLDALTSQEIPWADAVVIEDWWRSTEALYSSQLALQAEISDLTRTRDELLPLLMSGRVRVDEVVAA